VKEDVELTPDCDVSWRWWFGDAGAKERGEVTACELRVETGLDSSTLRVGESAMRFGETTDTSLKDACTRFSEARKKIKQILPKLVGASSGACTRGLASRVGLDERMLVDSPKGADLFTIALPEEFGGVKGTCTFDEGVMFELKEDAELEEKGFSLSTNREGDWG
jgi:hypothetical protein